MNQSSPPPDGRLDLARVALRAAKENARRNTGRTRTRREPARRRPGNGDPVSLNQALYELVSAAAPWLTDPQGVVAAWQKFVPKELARHLTATGFDASEGILELRADSTAWATQVRLLGPQLVRRFNQVLPAGSGPVHRLAVTTPVRGTVRRTIPPAARPPSTDPKEEPPRIWYLHSAAGTRTSARPDLAITAAVDRQAGQATREPASDHATGPGLRTPPPADDGLEADAVHARALLRARKHHHNPDIT